MQKRTFIGLVLHYTFRRSVVLTHRASTLAERAKEFLREEAGNFKIEIPSKLLPSYSRSTTRQHSGDP